MKRAVLFILITFSMTSGFAQNIDKISQLISAENFFAALAQESGIKKAFLTVSDENTIVFRPGPIQAEKFYKDEADNSGLLSWEPVYARIAKSGDWGFTTGPYTYQRSDTSGTVSYGDYLSVWKKNKKGVWKLAIDLGIPHPKPSVTPGLLFLNPENEKYIRQNSNTRLKQREDIILSNDKLFSTVLNADNKIAREEFLADDCRLLFPGYEPFKGINAVTAFWAKNKGKLSSQPSKVDRSYSGELAFSYGTAGIEQNGKNKRYHYVRIWAVQPGYKWQVILEVYTEAA